MKSTVYLALVAGTILACDDPEVAEKAGALLEFGLVQAKVVCASVPVLDASPGCTVGTSFQYTGQRLADGAAFVSVGFSPTFLIGRSEAGAECMEIAYSDNTYTACSGSLTVTRSGCTPDVTDISGECSGYNLDLFE